MKKLLFFATFFALFTQLSAQEKLGTSLSGDEGDDDLEPVRTDIVYSPVQRLKQFSITFSRLQSAIERKDVAQTTQLNNQMKQLMGQIVEDQSKEFATIEGQLEKTYPGFTTQQPVTQKNTQGKRPRRAKKKGPEEEHFQKQKKEQYEQTGQQLETRKAILQKVENIRLSARNINGQETELLQAEMLKFRQSLEEAL